MSTRVVRAVLIYGLLLLGCVIAVTPMIWMVSASLMETGAANQYPPRLFPERVTFEHYHALFTRLNLGRYLLNSVFVATVVTTASLLINSMAGYAFAKLRFRGRDRTFRFLTLGLVIPVQVSMLPLFLLMREMGFINTYWGVIIPGLASIFGIFLIRQYALGIPDELIDAARIDGASEFRIYWSVILPVVRPILATLAIWTFLSTWNDFMWPLIVLSDDSMFTLPVALANLSGESVQDKELMMACAVLTTLPVMLMFVFLQRYYVEGITRGSVKG
ncbi:MAG TPA: carbohydrate ABC transporter permease [Longimicrobiales bacterium]|nr:carbohydrate ABC transporter permease [Longimicrobiales bacterium]